MEIKTQSNKRKFQHENPITKMQYKAFDYILAQETNKTIQTCF